MNEMTDDEKLRWAITFIHRRSHPEVRQRAREYLHDRAKELLNQGFRRKVIARKLGIKTDFCTYFYEEKKHDERKYLPSRKDGFEHPRDAR